MNMYKSRSHSIYDGSDYELTYIEYKLFCTLVGFSICDGNFYQLIAKSITGTATLESYLTHSGVCLPFSSITIATKVAFAEYLTSLSS